MLPQMKVNVCSPIVVTMTLFLSAFTSLADFPRPSGTESGARTFLLEAARGTTNSPFKIEPWFVAGVTNEDRSPEFLGRLRAASESGNLVARGYLGMLLVKGDGVPRDGEEGIRLLRSSASMGCVAAMDQLGFVLLEGRGVPADQVEALKWIRLAAVAGNNNAQGNLGYCYRKGLGVPTNFVEAAVWFRRAAEQTNATAMMELGSLYSNGQGVVRDIAEAKRWFNKSAQAGNARAMLNLGRLAERGVLQSPISMSIAVEWYKRSAALNDRLGCWYLAVCYEQGLGVAKSAADYFHWTARAATQGLATAQFYLGDAYGKGKGVKIDRGLEVFWYRNAATNHYPHASYNVALEYLRGETNQQRMVEGMKFMLQAAEEGHREAALQYAFDCFRRNDDPLGAKWLLRSANEGWPRSEFFLASLYFNGQRGFQTNQSEGLRWLRKAVEHNSLEAQEALALRLIQGVGVNRDVAEALKLWRRAAEFGHANSQSGLGYALETEMGSKADLVEVCMWYELAMRQGLQGSQVNFSKLSPRMTEEQRQEALRRAGQFRAKSLPVLNPVVATAEELLARSP